MTMRWELRQFPRRTSEWQRHNHWWGSSYTLGGRQVCVLTIDEGNVKITSISVPKKHVTLTTKRRARFMLIREEVDIEAREVNRPVAYRAHICELYYVSVTSGYGSVDVRRFYVPYGLASENVRPTRTEIGLCLDEWSHLLKLLLLKLFCTVSLPGYQAK